MAFENFKKLGTRLIKKNGEDCILRVSRKPSPADPSKPWDGSPVPDDEDFPVVIAFFPETRQSKQTQKMVNRSNVPTGNTLGLLADFAPDVSTRDFVLRGIDQTKYTIESVSEIRPNSETTTLYILSLVGG